MMLYLVKDYITKMEQLGYFDDEIAQFKKVLANWDGTQGIDMYYDPAVLNGIVKGICQDEEIEEKLFRWNGIL